MNQLQVYTTTNLSLQFNFLPSPFLPSALFCWPVSS